MSCQAIDGDEEYTSVIRDVWVEDIEYLDTSMLQGRSAGREQLAPGHDPAVLKVLPPISPGARHEKNGLIARARYNTLNEDLPASFDAGNNSATLATVVWCEDLGECQIWADANNYCAVPVECSEATEWTCVFRNKDTCADIVYSGYIGGTGGDYTHAVAVDRDGAAYVSGETTSDETSFPVTVGPRLTMDGDNNVFVGKVRPDGTGMVYLGYIGGDGYTTKWGSHEVGVDGSGAFVVSGHTYSSAASFPHRIGPFDYRGGTISNGTFIAKVSPSGADLAYAGWMPGTSDGNPNDPKGPYRESGATVDETGFAYLAALVYSSGADFFPVTVGPSLTFSGDHEATISKIRVDGSGLVYAGFVGGTRMEHVNAVDIDDSGSAYIAGSTYSEDFPVLHGPYAEYKSGDGFIAKISPEGTRLAYAGYIGGQYLDWISAIAVHRRTGSATVAGYTTSDQFTFPVTVGPSLTLGGFRDAMVGKVRPDGSGMMFLGYIGGSSDEEASGVAVDDRGAIYVSGKTTSTGDSFPHVNGPSPLTYGGPNPTCFVAKVTPDGKDLTYAGFLFGNYDHADSCQGAAVDDGGAFYVGGYTYIDPDSVWPTKIGPLLASPSLENNAGVIVKLKPFDGCTTSSDCNDGNSCTDNVCGAGGLCSNPSNGTCDPCTSNAECDDGDSCTNHVCGLDGTCLRYPSGVCCESDSDCNDVNHCTANTCVDGFCAFPDNGLCCSIDEACDDGTCSTQNTCGQGWISTFPPVGPSARSYHAAATDLDRGRVVIYGGLPLAESANTWEWDGTSWLNRGTAGPGPRFQHEMVYDTLRQKTWLFGGYKCDGSSCALDNEIWEWDGTDWFNRTPDPYVGPDARYWHSMAYDEARNVTVLFGGEDSGSGYMNDTWEWNGTSWTELVLATGPSPRRGASMAFMPGRDRTVLFGGYQSQWPEGHLNDAWEWNGTTWTQLSVPGPAPQAGGKLSYDRWRKVLVLVGGDTGDYYDMNAMEFDGTKWSRALDTTLDNLVGFTLSYDPMQRKPFIVLGSWWEFSEKMWHFGGLDGACMTRATDTRLDSDCPQGDACQAGVCAVDGSCSLVETCECRLDADCDALDPDPCTTSTCDPGTNECSTPVWNETCGMSPACDVDWDCPHAHSCTEGVCNPALPMVSAGYEHACALDVDGQMSCWGANTHGNGLGRAGTYTTVSAGKFGTNCALESDGTMLCWGLNDFGQGNGVGGSHRDVSAGTRHSCSITTDGEAQCWGDDAFGQGTPSAGPGQVQIGAGWGHTCARSVVGEVSCWGDDEYGKSTLAPAGTYRDLSVGYNHSCVVDNGGTVTCWGDNSSGQTSVPAGTYVSVSAGASHTCAIRADDTLQCWGSNTHGESTPPTGTFRQVSAGSEFNCAMRPSGLIECWGLNTAGELNPPGGGTCALDGDCNDGDPCTINLCIEGWVVQSADDRLKLLSALGGVSFDSNRKVTVIVTTGETWEYDGTKLTRVSTSGPSAGGPMVFDTWRNVSVMVSAGKTWEWDGTNWRLASTGGPLARQWHGTAFDSLRGRTVLFGGKSAEGDLDDTWEWDGTNWTLRDEGGAGPGRRGISMAFDENLERVIMLGGESGEEACCTVNYRGTYAWDGTDWSYLGDSDNDETSYGAMTYHAGLGQVVYWGGRKYDWVPDRAIYGWNGTSWVVVAADTDGPPSRYEHRLAYDSARGALMAIGGINESGLETLSGVFWYYEPRCVSADNASCGPVCTVDGDCDDLNSCTDNVCGAGWKTFTTDGVPSPIPHRHGMGMAYDSSRHLLMLYGGNDGDPLQDTWSFDGTTWTQLATTGPPFSITGAMVYDARRDVLVYFGGTDEDRTGDFSGDTWEWDGVSWSRVAGTGPLPRKWAGMAYDANRQVTVLYGGINRESGRLQDTWEWNGVSWTERPVSGPPRRSEFVMAYDSIRGVVVLYGGRGARGEFLGDTWEWDGTSWMRVATTGPSARVFAVMAFDSGRGVMVMTGGVDAFGYVEETWEWDGTSWAEVVDSGMPVRAGHGMGYMEALGETVLFGGWTVWDGVTWKYSGPTGTCVAVDNGSCECQSDLNCDDGDPCTDTSCSQGWTQFGTSGPSPRNFSSMVYESSRQRMMLFGGHTYDDYFDDTWVWNGTVWAQIDTPGPSKRWGPNMAYDSVRDRAVLFGGEYNETYLGDTWEWDGTTWSQVATDGPMKRWTHGMTYDESRSRVVLFGGMGEDNIPRGDTWEWDGENWTEVVTPGPSGRTNAELVYDRVRGRTMLFGGRTEDTFWADTWVYESGVWTLLDVSGPSARWGHRMAYDSARDRVLLFGGRAGSEFLNDTWEWDGMSWTEVTDFSPWPRQEPGIAYDAARRETVIFGGVGDGAYFNDTWAWSGPSSICRSTDNGSCPAGCSEDGECLPGEACYAGECKDEACQGVTCGADFTCYGGTCFPQCLEDIECNPDSVCYDGRCAPLEDSCLGVICSASELCYGGSCFARCSEEIACDPDSVCYDGRCVAEICDGDVCEPDYCEGVQCGTEWICFWGTCFPQCNSTSCDPASDCYSGRCTDDPCEAVNCGPEFLCYQGTCFKECADDATCDPNSYCYNGRCAPNACYGVDCPVGQQCYEGSCFVGCSEDTDCTKADEYCFNERCAVNPCDGVQCREGYDCVEGTCFMPCGPDGACDPDHHCYQGYCAQNNCNLPEQIRCHARQTCYRGTCFYDCVDDDACDPNSFCYNGRCATDSCAALVADYDSAASPHFYREVGEGYWPTLAQRSMPWRRPRPMSYAGEASTAMSAMLGGDLPARNRARVVLYYEEASNRYALLLLHGALVASQGAIGATYSIRYFDVSVSPAVRWQRGSQVHEGLRNDEFYHQELHMQTAGGSSDGVAAVLLGYLPVDQKWTVRLSAAFRSGIDHWEFYSAETGEWLDLDLREEMELRNGPIGTNVNLTEEVGVRECTPQQPDGSVIEGICGRGTVTSCRYGVLDCTQTVAPWNYEVCDGRDTNCDGEVDNVDADSGLRVPMVYVRQGGDGNPWLRTPTVDEAGPAFDALNYTPVDRSSYGVGSAAIVSVDGADPLQEGMRSLTFFHRDLRHGVLTMPLAHGARVQGAYPESALVGAEVGFANDVASGVYDYSDLLFSAWHDDWSVDGISSTTSERLSMNWNVERVDVDGVPGREADSALLQLVWQNGGNWQPIRFDIEVDLPTSVKEWGLYRPYTALYALDPSKALEVKVEWVPIEDSMCMSDTSFDGCRAAPYVCHGGALFCPPVTDENCAGCRDRDGDGHLEFHPVHCPEGTDCNDRNPDAYPGAEERCDGADTNCDGFVDAIGPSSLYESCPGGEDICGPKECEYRMVCACTDGDCYCRSGLEEDEEVEYTSGQRATQRATGMTP